uniref:Calponin-homology (CH) domain-containing protein n=1 Tax=Anabas testudineus TaxID=64144 RepID=A0A7N6BWI8_ANATE
MSEILCRWLNQELRLSKLVEPKTFAKDFSSGYLIGEVLHKYQLQNDFSMFMKKDSLDCEVPGSGTKLILQSNSKYIQEIRQRLEENAIAHEQRRKRRDRFLLEQLKAHEAQEEAQREEQLVKRLTRQTQQEQRLAAQLLQIRMQKEVIWENRLFREQQYQQRRDRDFREALEKEAALAQQAKLEHAEEIRKELEFLNRSAAERGLIRYQKHFKFCKDILEQIVDLATKVGEYRLLTGLIPGKQMREWKELLFSGLPLYEPIKGQQPSIEFSTPLDPVEREKQEILNNQDYDEYTSMVGEWVWPEEAGATNLTPANNDILGHVVLRLRNIVHPPVMEPSTPSFPHFTLKACVLGKFCSGKTTCLTKIAEGMLSKHVQAHTNTMSHHLKKYLLKGNTIPNELLMDIIVDAIRQVPAQSGWILDGFPADITQAYLLEKALGGSVDIGNDGKKNKRINLAADPNQPKPPPPPTPVLDLALLLDIPDESVVQRAYSHIETHTAADTTSPPIDQNLYLAQIPHRITAFQDAWPKLEKWFGGKQNILVHVDATVDKEELYNKVEIIFILLYFSFGFLIAPSRKASAYSVTYEDSQRVPKNPPESVFPCPGSSSWVYVDEPLPPEIPEYLCSYWDTVCDSYVNNIKTVMQQLRSQHTVINHHLFNIRYSFKHYLGRPNLKQELVSQWQKDFNSISDDMREDEDTKAELHLRLDELRERLWDISDKRKEQDEQERTALIGNGWLEDHIAILINHHSTLIQVTFQFFTSWFHHIFSSQECTDFYLNGDCRMVASPIPPPRPPPHEKPTHSTPTITQLESLHQQLCHVAPSGLMSSSEFFKLLRDFTSVSMGTNTLPEPWINKNETQLMEIVSMLTDQYELIDWRRFLLSAALPWPFPSLTELLHVLQRFKAEDNSNTGYISKEQYLQTELWFSSEGVQPVPEDPSEPLPYDRLANLRKFFFQLFADHSISSPQLDYVSMLQYFAADANPRQGFIRALSVVIGQHLNIEVATELSSSELDGEYKEGETLCASSGSVEEKEVSVPALVAVICHKATKMKDGFPLPPGCVSQEEHTEVLKFNLA